MHTKIFTLLIIILINLICSNTMWFYEVRAEQTGVANIQLNGGEINSVIVVENSFPKSVQNPLQVGFDFRCNANVLPSQALVQAQPVINLHQPAKCYKLASVVHQATLAINLQVEPLQLPRVSLVVKPKIIFSSEHLNKPIAMVDFKQVTIVMQWCFVSLILVLLGSLVISNKLLFKLKLKKVFNLFELMILRW